MTVSDFLRMTFVDCKYPPARPRVECSDGYSISVQGNEFSYCTPRITCYEYLAVELGFPSSQDPLINELGEDPANPTGTVYPYVGIEVVEKLIESHGGISQDLIDSILPSQQPPHSTTN